MSGMKLAPSKMVEAVAMMMAYAGGSDIATLAQRHRCSEGHVRQLVYTGLAEADLDRFLMLCHPSNKRISRNALRFVREDAQQWLDAGRKAVRATVRVAGERDRAEINELAHQYGDYAQIIEECSRDRGQACG